MARGYLPRLIDRVLENYLGFYGAVLIEGCKWCGKSTTARYFAESYLELQNPQVRKMSLELVELSPEVLLKGDKPRLIDEWQDVPEIWDAVRYDVDRSGLAGQYILTGSATPRQNKPRHSGIGRIARLKMRPMSLFESGDSTGEVSIKGLFDGDEISSKVVEQSLSDIAFLCARGGWPLSVVRSKTSGIRIARDYLNVLVQNDISSGGVVGSYNASKMRRLIRSLARNIATPVSLNTIVADVQGDEMGTFSKVTAASYLEILENLHIMDDVEAWMPKLRSKTEARMASKRNFVDPSLAVAALFASEKDLLNDLNTFGLIFESLVLRDLKIYMQGLDGEVLYYRDSYGQECDAILHLEDGRWAAVEVKLGSSESIEEGAKSLLKLRDKIDTGKMKEPAFMMVVTAASKYAYRRGDGVFVVPIGCLRD